MSRNVNSRPGPRAWLIVLQAGVLAGTLDIVFACMFWALKAGAEPQRILQSVAAGLLGPATYEGGLTTAVVGMGLQLFIATAMAAAYWVVARQWLLLRHQPVASGAAYGLLLYVLMNYVVVPLSAASPGPTDPLWIGTSILAHVVLVGIPIALLCSRPSPGPDSAVSAAPGQAPASDHPADASTG